jgi:cellulose synthase (UDP-forming)
MGQFLAVQFILPVSVERDLLIRKLFTAGLDTTNVSTSVWIATSTMLASIWNLRTEILKSGTEQTPDVAVASPVEQLPAQSLVISPQPQRVRLSELVEQRRAIAA